MGRGSARSASLARAVAAAVDDAFSHAQLQAFSRLRQSDGTSIRRYYRETPAAECEVSVYRDKWWDASGGHVYAELYCLVGEYQRLLGGSPQSWREPDYAKPLLHFQYSTGDGAERPGWKVASSDDAAALGAALQAFLLARGIRWLDRFESREGVTGYLEEQRAYAPLAEWHARLGESRRALRAFGDFMAAHPRDIETPLRRMLAAGVIDETESRRLLRSSLQHADDYGEAVAQWRRERGL